MLGIGLPAVLSARKANAAGNPRTGQASRRPKSVVLIFLTGAPSHHDTFDMKPEAPAEVRGEFQAVATSVPGLHVCEHLPQLAVRAHQYALVRSLSHGDNNHLVATHHVLTGSQQPGAFFDKVASRDDYPCYASGCDYLRPRHDGIPNGVNLPHFLASNPLTWPGQHAGFLGAKHDPWQITRDPNKPDFQLDSSTACDCRRESTLPGWKTGGSFSTSSIDNSSSSKILPSPVGCRTSRNWRSRC